MTEQTKTVEEMVADYIVLRTAIAELEEEHEAAVQRLKDQMDDISNKLLDICGEQNVDSLRTPSGTVSRRIKSRYWTSDWESFYKFVREHDALELLEQRIHQGNMKQFLEENPEEFPMGLQADRKYVVQVRKPTSR